jgi:hypothetical protein
VPHALKKCGVRILPLILVQTWGHSEADSVPIVWERASAREDQAQKGFPTFPYTAKPIFKANIASGEQLSKSI